MDTVLLVDGGWLMQSRLHIFSKEFQLDRPEIARQSAAREFKEMMARSITVMLNKFPEIDNIVLTSEGGSWRKMLPIPDYLKRTVDISSYKGHRERDVEMDWDTVYEAYKEFAESCEEAGITCSQHSMIEGDDWIWYWSRKLNASGKDVIIWSTDQDLKQLVQIYNNRFTAWYNDKNGLFLPYQCKQKDDLVEAMMNPSYNSLSLEGLIRKAGKVEYIFPDAIAIDKILCGDAGDNIKSIATHKHGERYRNFTNGDKEKLWDYLGHAINTMDEFKESKDVIIKWILSNRKFIDKITREDLEEMFEYNTKLVWLNESVLPDSYTKAMVQFQLGECDVLNIKRNYKLLLGTDKKVESIFDDIFKG